MEKSVTQRNLQYAKRCVDMQIYEAYKLLIAEFPLRNPQRFHYQLGNYGSFNAEYFCLQLRR